MNEDFVSFDLAKKLKEKGFRYNKNNLLDRLCMENQINHPTISQVLKWLREEGIFIEIHTHDTFATKNKVAYWCCIKRNSNGVRIEQIDELKESYADYEKAAMDGIEYVLDNLI